MASLARMADRAGEKNNLVTGVFRPSAAFAFLVSYCYAIESRVDAGQTEPGFSS